MRILVILLIWATPVFGVVKSYEVRFDGVHNEEILDVLKVSSQLIALKEKAPKTHSALQRRAEADIPNLVKALHSMAYFNARVTFTVEETTVTYQIEPGPVYPIEAFRIEPEELNICPWEVGIIIGQPAFPKDILEAEESVIEVLASRGYPLATLEGKEVIADQECKTVSVVIHVDSGPLAYFGETTVTGNKRVCEAFIRNKIRWQEGCLYDPLLVNRTLTALESAGLFRSITITHSEEQEEDLSLPMTIEVKEGKHRSLGLGFGVSTQRGAGVTAEWEHRNYFGMGDRVFFETNLLWNLQEAKLTYLKPDFRILNQDLLLETEFIRDKTKGYTETSFRVAGILERQLSDCTRISYGLENKQLRTSRSDNNGEFNLLKVSLKYKWFNTDDALDPHTGISFYFKSVPTMQLFNPQFFYTINSTVLASHYPLGPLVFAGKVYLGSILGASRKTIPASERFYAGSESLMRGYRYYTVSPLDSDNDPIGGRSMLVYSLETRWRATETWGFVTFFDAGNVYRAYWPQLNEKLLKSGGFGVRYFTPVGPLRFDVAFPFNRRKGVDKSYQLYFSVGQAF